MDEITKIISAVRENFRFLTLEVRKQLEGVRAAIADPRESALRAIVTRDDYIDNLRSVIENKCYRLLGDARVERRSVDLVRAINTSTNNLERIADYCVNIVGQLGFLSAPQALTRFEYAPFVDELVKALDRVDQALFSRDLSGALAICRAEYRVDELYVEVFRRIMASLRAGDAPEDLVTSLFIFRYLERAGDCLLNIGEAIILAALGEKLKVSEFQALQETLAASEVGLDISDIDYEGIWETRSGSRIGAVHGHEGASDTRWVIFKEGRTGKVLEEKEAIERWQKLEPGLTPQIFGYHDHGAKASLLLEFLRGETFQSLVFDGGPELVRKAFAYSTRTIAQVWTRTLEREPIAPRFVHQLRKRLPDVLKVHPDLARERTRIGDFAIASFDELLERAAPLDELFAAPFSVMIHGDFNTDNIIVNQQEGRVHFIDLHRSTRFDYLQDVSVFLVSNFRMPVFEPRARAQLNEVNVEFYKFAAAFATRNGDHTFAARLALGLARSLVTSTRFQLDGRFAGAMFMRAEYLLEQLVAHLDRGAPWADYVLPEGVFTYW